ncbi:MAG: hypothetical protein IJH20_05280 [Bacilli bacterium]|nr:hypothetical protein [Bacilli bacterium]
MYKTIEIFEGELDLKEILKSSFYNYYKKRINELQKVDNKDKINMTISNILSNNKEGVCNV